MKTLLIKWKVKGIAIEQSYQRPKGQYVVSHALGLVNVE